LARWSLGKKGGWELFWGQKEQVCGGNNKKNQRSRKNTEAKRGSAGGKGEEHLGFLHAPKKNFGDTKGKPRAEGNRGVVHKT